MTEEALLSIAITGSPPRAVFTRSAAVPDDLWFSIPLNVAPGSARVAADEFEAPIDRFLASRRWLSDACRQYDVDVEIDEAARELLERGRAEREAVHQHLDRARPMDAAVVPGPDQTNFERRLMPFQQRDLRKLLTLEHGANFSVPGAGKTTVTYALYAAERARDRVARLVVVSPISAFETWEVEAVRCFAAPPSVGRYESGDLDAEVLLINYQRLNSARSTISDLMMFEPTHLVLDEAHRMKRGRLGEWGNACLDLARLAARRDILTGTPAPHSPRDFIALIDFVWPDQARMILPSAALTRDPPDDAMDQVNDALDPLFVRTTKRELGLTPPTVRVELVQQGALQAEIYDALRSRYGGMYDLGRRDAAIFAQMGEVTMYLLEAATNPSLLARPAGGVFGPVRYPPLAIPPGSRLSELVGDYSRHEVPPKFQKLAYLVDQNARAGRKTLVWSNFVGNLLTLEQTFARYQPALIYGGVPSSSSGRPAGTRTRETELERFRSDASCLVLLANPAATAEGISLHDVCHDAIYLERTFNAGQYLQSIDRIHRLGLAPDIETNITFLLTEGSIDEAVDARVRLKAERLSQMLNDRDLVTMALPDDEDYGEILDDLGDLDALFAHLAGDDD